MKRNKSIVLGIIVILLIMVALLGITYAFYETNIIGNTKEEKSVNLTSDKLEIIYDTEENNEPITGSVGETENNYNKVFTIKSTAKEKEKYTIILDNIENNFIKTWNWSYKLYKIENEDNTLITEGIIGNTLKRQVIKAEEEIEAGGTNKYKLEVTYDNTIADGADPQVETGTNLKFRINIMSVNENIFKEDVQKGTLLYAIGENNSIVNPQTIPGQKPSASDEKELSYTTDDYGTSYYFRGKVDNNFVTFADMCWRIVRVQGDGSIKITLYDETSPCGSSENHPNGAFMSEKGEGKTIYKTSYNDSYTDKTYAKYGLSKIRSALNDWYGFSTINLHTYDNQIDQDAEWCSDVSESTTEDGNIYFGAYNRLEIKSTAKPSLKCKTLEGGSNDSIYTDKLALLSADEYAFAGADSGYLPENAKDDYWTLSPYNFEGNVARAWNVRMGGDLYYSMVGPMYAVRPTTVLKSNVTISAGQDGTKTNPYVIQAQ